MLIRRAPDLRWSDVTPKAHYLRRREFFRTAAVPLVAGAAGWGWSALDAEAQGGLAKLTFKKSPLSTTGEELTPYADVTTYNNFYEFGIDKDSPSRFAQEPAAAPLDGDHRGAVGKGGQFAIDDLIKPYQLEERVYRLRCVEAWSMVIPWVGFPLGDLIRKVEPTAKAKYVEFTTLLDPEQMPGVRRRSLDWPYVEGLRLDEAMHPLTILAVGLYGEVLPNQNGAPLRLVVPWKYGFKSIKSIVRIRLVEKQPRRPWERSQPSEYGFYSNVNPEVDHPRWSQARERRIGEFFKRKTLMFNGYGDQVARSVRGHGSEEELLEEIADCRLQIDESARLQDCRFARCRRVARRSACSSPRSDRSRICVYGVFADTLGANPIDAITDETGTWTLRFLALTLLVTPLRKWTGWNPLIRFRRMLGLFAFFYGTLHFLTYLLLDQFFAFDEHRGRHRQAAVHHGGLHGVRADDPAGPHLHGRLDSAAGRQALEPAAPAGLSVGHRRRRALLVAGQERHLPSGALRRGCRVPARGARLVRLQCATWSLLAPCRCWFSPRC